MIGTYLYYARASTSIQHKIIGGPLFNLKYQSHEILSAARDYTPIHWTGCGTHSTLMLLVLKI